MSDINLQLKKFDMRQIDSDKVVCMIGKRTNRKIFFNKRFNVLS